MPEKVIMRTGSGTVIAAWGLWGLTAATAGS